MQPAFVVGNDSSGTNRPYARFRFFDKDLPSCIFLSKRNLPTRADDLDAYLHVNFLESVNWPRQARLGQQCNHAYMLHDSTIS